MKPKRYIVWSTNKDIDLNDPLAEEVVILGRRSPMAGPRILLRWTGTKSGTSFRN